MLSELQFYIIDIYEIRKLFGKNYTIFCITNKVNINSFLA